MGQRSERGSTTYICIGDHLRDAIASGVNAVRSRVYPAWCPQRHIGAREGTGG